MKGAHWYPLVIVLTLVCANECNMAGAQDWTEHEVTIAKIAVNEESFRTAGASAIAAARGRYTVEQLRAMHSRALAPVRTDSRRWIADLSGDMHRPDGWPERLVPWSRGQQLWLAVLVAVRETLRGERIACGGERPSIWGGTMDAAHIRRRIEQGYVVVTCQGSANTYLRRR
jgi:hypothetical protein